MPAASAPFGYHPAYHPNGRIRVEALKDGILSGYTTGLLKFQPVQMATTGVIQAFTSSGLCLGTFMGCEYQPSAGARRIYSNQWTASATYVAGSMIAYFTSDPLIVYRVQADGVVAQTAIGDQADGTNLTNGSTTTGLSEATVASSLKGAGVQGNFRIIGLDNDVGNAWSDAFTNLFVQIAEHPYVNPQTAI